MHNHSYKNEFHLQLNEISFSYERMGTKTRFKKEAKGNSEMTYSTCILETNVLFGAGGWGVASLCKMTASSINMVT